MVTLAAAIIIGNLNLIFILLFLQSTLDKGMGWTYWIPRIGHDVVAACSVVFWIWVVVDAYRCSKSI
jgi:hypothetical protein